MDFKEVGNRMYFPPTIPNGEIIGYAPGATDIKRHLLSVTDDGLSLSGIFIEWETIEGVSEGETTHGSTIVVHSNKYATRDFVFFQQGMNFRLDQYDEHERLHRGYPISYTLMNRITFELQRIEREIDIF